MAPPSTTRSRSPWRSRRRARPGSRRHGHRHPTDDADGSSSSNNNNAVTILLMTIVAAIAVAAVQCQCQFRGATILAAAAAECEVQPDGTEVCTFGELNPSATADDDDAPPPSSASNDNKHRKPLSSSDHMNDPEWREKARRNNVVTDPDEIRRIHARYEADRAAGRTGEMKAGGDWADAHGEESESPKAYADGDGEGITDSAEAAPEEEEEPPERIRYEEGGLLVTSAHECVDLDDDCLYQISTSSDPGECMDPPEISRLARRCRRSCRLCTTDDEKKGGEQVRRTSIGVAQRNDGIESEREVVSEVLDEMVRYLREEVLVEPGYEDCYRDCTNRHELCAFWASVGECTGNPTYMDEHCPLACKRCNLHPEYLHRMIL